MPICGRASSGEVMWVAMMVAMMLPSLVPTLWRCRQSVGDRLALLVGVGYVLVWTVFSLIAFPLAVALTSFEMRFPVVPIGVILIAGAFQFSTWKARHLACCRAADECRLPADAGAALWHGLRLGVRCGKCCANLMAIMLVVGMMDTRVMAALTAAITLERLAPAGQRLAQVVGLVVSGLSLIV